MMDVAGTVRSRSLVILGLSGLAVTQPLLDLFGRNPEFFVAGRYNAGQIVWFALVVAFVFSHAAMYGPQAAFFSELFGTRVRYSGASLGAQLAAVLAGGTSPFIATLLLANYGTNALSLYLIFMAGRSFHIV